MRTLARGWMALALLAAMAATAAERIPVSVTLGPDVEAALAARYGVEEGAVLRAIVDESLTAALAARARQGALPQDLTVDVVITEATPTHPTRQQLHANPAIDALRSRSVGGAALEATVRAGGGRPVATIVHRRYAPDLATAAAGGDAWADARIAIRQLATRVADAVPAAAAGPTR